MSLRGFQEAAVDLTLAPDLCRALRRGESAVLDRYDLNQRERNRLLDIALQPGIAMNCALARGNRLELIVEAFPKTCTLIKSRLPRLLDELWEQLKPDNTQLFGEENAFAAFIARKVSQGELDVEYLPEIFALRTCVPRPGAAARDRRRCGVGSRDDRRIQASARGAAHAFEPSCRSPVRAAVGRVSNPDSAERGRP